jgi:hypothetical protein
MARNFRFVAGALLAAAIQSVSAQVLVDPGAKPDRGANPRDGMPERVDAGRCNGSLCILEVKVKVSAGGACEIRVDPEVVFIGGKQVRMIWEIKTPGYSFDPVNGLRFKDDYNPLWRTEFYPLERSGQPASKGRDTWQLLDANNQPGTFRYAVTVINERTREQCSVDPGVVNDWS